MTKLNLFPNEDYNLDKRKKGEIDSELEKELGKTFSRFGATTSVYEIKACHSYETA
ncbi:hypothetical protein COLO4_00372 [Corchorus olitorius]|uniref:Uncharacterized protein n=1 Tax=Corchorus olitorius TaxID=93759 RepID=A0A1R3L416_9ROSI|nr:hypothetical protein COLO4_00372 [Corchorus olitorius]